MAFDNLYLNFYTWGTLTTSLASVAQKSPPSAAIKIAPNKELAKELHKPINKKFEKWKVHSSFIDNIWGADSANVQLLSKFDKEICF